MILLLYVIIKLYIILTSQLTNTPWRLRKALAGTGLKLFL